MAPPGPVSFLVFPIERLRRSLLKLSRNDFLKDFLRDMLESSVAEVSVALNVQVADIARRWLKSNRQKPCAVPADKL